MAYDKQIASPNAICFFFFINDIKIPIKQDKTMTILINNNDSFIDNTKYNLISPIPNNSFLYKKDNPSIITDIIIT